MTSFLWTDAEVAAALSGVAEVPAGAGSSDRAYTGISTDTRALKGGELFVAIVGETHDGHAYLEAAQARGARGAIVNASAKLPAGLTLSLWRVPDTRVAFGLLGRHRRRALGGRVVGLTGSAGKTSVKELLTAALTPSFRVHATYKNENNQFGVPLTLLAAPSEAEVAVLEMGTSEPGEIAALAAIAEPDLAILTTVSEAHLERLGSFEGVLQEKLALLAGARPGAELLVGDEPVELVEGAKSLRPETRVAGFSERADPELRGELLSADAIGRYTLRAFGREIRSPFPGKHGARNLLIALAAAHLLGADLDAAAAAMNDLAPRPESLRTEIRRIGELTLLVDCYNANPQSTAAALELLAEMEASGGRVAFLASMLELGDRSAALHRGALEHALSLPLDLVVGVGEYAPHAEVAAASGTSPVEVIPAVDREAGYAALRPRLSGRETVLLKGSRGTALEKLIPLFERDFGDPSAKGGQG